ncbi:hypothetical protein NKG05_12075 [Oerskovia sp. M15]
MTLDVEDDGALASVQYSTDNGATWTTVRAANGVYGVNFTTDGVRNLQYRATDTGGNVSTVGSVSFAIDLTAPDEPTVASATTASVPSARVSFGAPGEATVTVTGTGGTPTGDVVLTSGDTEVGRGTLANGVATVALDPRSPSGRTPSRRPTRPTRSSRSPRRPSASRWPPRPRPCRAPSRPTRSSPRSPPRRPSRSRARRASSPPVTSR